MAELGDGMFELGGLRRRPIAPDARDLRYKLLRPFKKALHGAAPAAKLDRSVETVRGWDCG